jgi:membrane-associated phospholipid phosphatase
MTILQSLEKLDKDLFVLINHGSGYPIIDSIMILIRNPLTWIPFYLFMAWWIIVRLKKKAWLFIFCTLATIALTDPTTAFILKPLFERLRPCHEPTLDGIVRILDGCGGKYSFPSNHAANHFGLATFWFSAIRKMTGQKWYWLWCWAFLICYAQIYIGKHYPGDIVAGTMLGAIAGSLTYRIFIWLLRITQKNPAGEIS